MSQSSFLYRSLQFALGTVGSIAPTLFSTSPVFSQSWQPVRGSIQYGISGIAAIADTDAPLDFLVVHDNKREDEGRLAVLSLSEEGWPDYQPLAWPSETPLPVDLEALSAVPGTSSFAAVESDGTVYHVSLDRETRQVSVLGQFDLPELPPGSNVEGFALQTVEERLLAVWGHRGNGEDPARLYWAIFDPQTYQFGEVASRELRVPYPGGSVRHISDLKLDAAGILYIAAASDDGNDGPFASAVYAIGVFDREGDTLNFLPSSGIPLTSTRQHKVEALELTSGAEGGLFLGTDDESFGSFIWRSHDF
ncbi:hypothetical protein [Baaleninema sp.]|uniref:hypothetical protein n=1 Tax=Baaleninema sp. TaxID=3101197 RepID=UPI003D02E1B6